MTNLQMNDTWLENVFFAEFKGDSVSFLDNYKSLLSEKRKREKRTMSLLQRYKNAELSVGKIAEKLNLDREDIWALMKKYNVDLVDCSWNDESKNVDKFLSNY